MNTSQIEKATLEVGQFNHDECNLEVIESAFSTLGQVPRLGEHGVTDTLKASALGTTHRQRRKRRRQGTQENSQNQTPTGCMASLSALRECQLRAFDMREATYLEINRHIFPLPDNPPYNGSLPAKGLFQELDRMRAKGDYDSAAIALSNALLDLREPEFFCLSWNLTRDIKASHHVMEAARQAFGETAPRIDTMSIDSMPLVSAIHDVAQEIEASIPSQFSGLLEIRSAIQITAYENALDGMNITPHLPMLKDQCVGGSVAAKVVLAEVAMRNEQFHLADKILSDPDVQNSPTNLVHRRKGELALRRGDGAAAADAFEAAALIPNENLSNADRDRSKTTQLARLSDYYLIFRFEEKYIIVPQDRMVAGLTRVAGRPVLLLKDKQQTWLERKAFDAARKVKHLLDQRFLTKTAPTQSGPTISQVSQFSKVRNYVKSTATMMWSILANFIRRIGDYRSWIARLPAPLTRVLTAGLGISRRVLSSHRLKKANQLKKRVVNIAKPALRPAFRILIQPVNFIVAAGRRWAQSSLKDIVFHASRAIYRTLLGPIVMKLVGAQVVQPHQIATDLNQLIECLSDTYANSDDGTRSPLQSHAG